MKVHIIFKFQDGPYGGGNQFLKALREEFRKQGNYAENEKDADAFLFNSFQDFWRVIMAKLRYPDKPFVHRIDGPISVYRASKNIVIDKLIFSLNEAIADATIFQSNFSKKENERLGMKPVSREAVISNSSDSTVFFKKECTPSLEGRKIKLISTSWSKNPMKGFDVYMWLDGHLDFSKYEYLFVGNSTVTFRNIKMLPPQPSNVIAKLLRDSDIYVTASKKDPCSNSLIEALSCGIPAIALHDGGHPELIQHGGETFETSEEIPEKLEKLCLSYSSYKENIPCYTMRLVAKEYFALFQKIERDVPTKKLNLSKIIRLFFLFATYHIKEML